MKDGLGPKYGGPRRVLQEKIRTEMSRSQITSESIDKKIQELALLCRSHCQKESKREIANPSRIVSLQIRLLLLELREEMYLKGLHLNCFKVLSFYFFFSFFFFSFFAIPH